MSIRDELLAQATAKPCKVGRWLTSLEDETRGEFIELIAEAGDGELPMKHLWRVAVDHGYDGSDTVFERHIKVGCACERP